MKQLRVTFLPDGTEAWVPTGSNLLAAAAAAHMAVDAPCGDRGVCGKCKVQQIHPLVHSGTDGGDEASSALPTALEPPTLHERTLIPAGELAEGWRLACQARVTGDVTVAVPERALQPAVVPLSQIEPHPAAVKRHLRLPKPSLEDPASDLTRLRRSLADDGPDLQIDLPSIPQLQETLRAASYDVTATRVGDRLIGFEPGDTTDRCFGLAVDLGTTSVVAILVDLNSAQVLGIESRLNGQANYGMDVISRITHAAQPDGVATLQRAAVDTINLALATLAERTGIDSSQIYEAVVVGNTCMNHLLLGIDPRSLALAPYHPVVADAVSCRAFELGLAINPKGVVYTLPNVAGFVGSDTIAVILATGMHKSEEIRLALDLGTNGEMVLGNRHRLLACSTAAGPAFEGARISCGMRATQGAIERVWIDEGKVELQVIGQGPAIGVCGSGLMDAVAQMLRAGLLDPSGRITSPEGIDSSNRDGLAHRIVRNGGVSGFTLARRGRRPVVLTQRDVRELQLAKGAIRAGILILLREFGIEEDDVAEVLLAGAFGSYISPASARDIGLIPHLPLDRLTAVGNAAGQGAVMALLSTEQREEAIRVAQAVQHVELAAQADFQRQFMNALSLDGSLQ